MWLPFASRSTIARRLTVRNGAPGTGRSAGAKLLLIVDEDFNRNRIRRAVYEADLRAVSAGTETADRAQTPPPLPLQAVSASAARPASAGASARVRRDKYCIVPVLPPHRAHHTLRLFACLTKEETARRLPDR